MDAESIVLLIDIFRGILVVVLVFFVFQHRNFLLAIEIYRRRIVVTNFENKKDGLTIAPSLNPAVDITLLQNIALELGIAITNFQSKKPSGQWLRVTQTGEHWTETHHFSFPVVDINYEVVQCDGPRGTRDYETWQEAIEGNRVYGTYMRISARTYEEPQKLMRAFLHELRGKLKRTILRCVYRKEIASVFFIQIQGRLFPLEEPDTLEIRRLRRELRVLVEGLTDMSLAHVFYLYTPICRTHPLPLVEVELSSVTDIET